MMQATQLLAVATACALMGGFLATDAEAGPRKRARLMPAERNLVHAAGARTFAGHASYYWHGRKTASGARFNPGGLTAAHRSLPFGTQLRVSDPRSGRSVVVTVNDRGPFIRGRVLDLSLGAARALGMTGRGVMHVQAQVL